MRPTNRFAGWNEAGERLVEADWTTVEAWDRLTEQCGRFLHTGSRVRVIGSLQTQSWDDRESGQKRYKTVVRAEDVLFLGARQEAHDEPEAVEETVEDLPFYSDWRSLISHGSGRLVLERIHFLVTYASAASPPHPAASNSASNSHAVAQRSRSRPRLRRLGCLRR